MVFVPVNLAILMFLYSVFFGKEPEVISAVEGPSVVHLTQIIPSYLPVLGAGVFVAFTRYHNRNIKGREGK